MWVPAIFCWSIDEEQVAADEDDEAHDGPGHVGGVAGKVSVKNFMKRLEMSYLNSGARTYYLIPLQCIGTLLFFDKMTVM